MKKLAIVSMIAMMAFGTVACGSNDAAADAATVAATEAAAAATEAATEAAEAATEAATELTGPQEAAYTIYNVTGEKVTKVTLIDQADNSEVASAEDLADGENTVLSVTVDAAETEDKVYTLHFETESGYTAEFTTLHFEVAPIQLIAADAMTGATPITFAIPE